MKCIGLPRNCMSFWHQESLLESLHALKGFSKSRRFQHVINKIIHDISYGKQLSTSLEQFPNSFPPFYIISVKSGENVGKLIQSLKTSHEAISWVNENRTKIFQATIYPLISLLILIFSFITSLRFLTPYFIESLNQMSAPIPPITQKMDKLNDLIRLFTQMKH